MRLIDKSIVTTMDIERLEIAQKQFISIQFSYMAVVAVPPPPPPPPPEAFEQLFYKGII